MNIRLLLMFTLQILIVGKIDAQQCLSGECSTFTNQYPSGIFSTTSTSWSVVNGSNAMNAGNYTLFSVTAGNTYEWSYCESYGGVSTAWDAQLTLFDNANLSTPLCFSTDVCGTNGNAPYISWPATFTGTVRLLTTAYSGGGCKTNSGSPYNKLVWRQSTGSCTPPSTPTGLTATAVSSSQINLSWNAVSGAIGYDIYYCDGTYITYTTSTSFQHTGRVASTTYSYKIDAQKSSTCVSSNTSCVSATTQSSCTPPSTPTGLTATTISASEIDLSWNTNPGAVGYDIYYCDGTFITYTTSTSFQHNGRVASTTYSYKIDAQKSSTCVSSNTSCVSATTQSSCTPPSTPTGLAATAVSASEIDLSWNAAPGAVGYDIYYCDGTFITYTTSTSFQHTGRVTSTTYSYKIDAQKSSTCVSSNTSCVSATTQSNCTPPSTPTGLAATAVSASEIDLSWNAAPGAVGYDIYYCDGTFITYTTSTSFQHIGRVGNTTYSYKIDAQKSSTCISPVTVCVNATTFPVNPTISISSSQIPPWQREGDDFNGSVTVDLSQAGPNATWHLEADYFNANGYQGPIIYPSLTSSTLTQNFSTVTDAQLRTYSVNGNYFTWNVVLESNNNKSTASQQTNIIEEQWRDKNLIYYNNPNGNNEIKIPAKYDPNNLPVNMLFSRVANTSSETDNWSPNGIFTIGTDGYFHVNLNNSNLGTVSPGLFTYEIYSNDPFSPETGQIDLTKIGNFVGFNPNNDTLVVLIGGNANTIENDFQNLNADPSKYWSVAENFRYGYNNTLAHYNTWYIGQPNTNYIENNGYDLGIGLDSILKILQSNNVNINHVVLFAHSFGGDQVKAMLGGMGRKLSDGTSNVYVPFSNYNINPPIEKVIFLATPHNGVIFGAGEFININVAGNAGVEMTNGSQFLTDLENAYLPNTIKFLNITGDDPTNALTDFLSGQPSDGVIPVWSSETPVLKKTFNTYFIYPQLSQLYVNYDIPDNILKGDWLHTWMHKTSVLNSSFAGCAPSNTILNWIFKFIRDENIANSTTNTIWSGVISSDWTNGSNWSCGTVPDATNDITIPSGTLYSPIIPDGITVSCRSLTLMAGANLTIGSNAHLNVLH